VESTIKYFTEYDVYVQCEYVYLTNLLAPIMITLRYELYYKWNTKIAFLKLSPLFILNNFVFLI
jgi:hypothetical protein